MSGFTTAKELFRDHVFETESERIDKRLNALYEERAELDARRGRLDTQIAALLAQRAANYDSAGIDDGSRDAEDVLSGDDDDDNAA